MCCGINYAFYQIERIKKDWMKTWKSCLYCHFEYIPQVVNLIRNKTNVFQAILLCFLVLL